MKYKIKDLQWSSGEWGKYEIDSKRRNLKISSQKNPTPYLLSPTFHHLSLNLSVYLTKLQMNFFY